jgi:peptidoglycan hydrolase-like protein with peptidoglycan-binding domain
VQPNGLAEMKSGEGTLIAFATSPGQTALDGKAGENSPFTKALIANLAEPGLEVGLALTKVRAQVQADTDKQQVPWTNTNLTGFVYVNPSQGAPNTQVAAINPTDSGAAARNAAAGEIELEFWRSVRDTNKPEELGAYLKRYPNGTFAAIARSRLAELQAEQKNAAPTQQQPSQTTAQPAKSSDSVHVAVTTKDTEDELKLDRAERREIQTRLSALGYYKGKVNGYFGNDARTGIERWQAARHYPKSGYFNRQQHEALLNEEMPVQRSTAPAPAPRQQQAAPRQAQPRPSAPPPRQQGIDPGTAAIIGGIAGGIIGGVLRR